MDTLLANISRRTHVDSNIMSSTIPKLGRERTVSLGAISPHLPPHHIAYYYTPKTYKPKLGELHSLPKESELYKGIVNAGTRCRSKAMPKVYLFSWILYILVLLLYYRDLLPLMILFEGFISIYIVLEVNIKEHMSLRNISCYTY